MSKAKELAKHIFAQYPKAKEVYITADNSTFLVKQYADSHAKNLKDTKVETITPDDLKEVAPIEPAKPEEPTTTAAPANPEEQLTPEVEPTPADDKVKAVKQLIADGKTAEAVAAAKLLTEDETATLSKKDKKFLADNAPVA